MKSLDFSAQTVLYLLLPGAVMSNIRIYAITDITRSRISSRPKLYVLIAIVRTAKFYGIL